MCEGREEPEDPEPLGTLVAPCLLASIPRIQVLLFQLPSPVEHELQY